MSRKETLEKAYGSIPKEVGLGYALDFNLVPVWRGLKYYWYKLVRKTTR